MGRYQKYQRKLKYITVLGSTGSIGTQTLEIASELPEKFKAVALSAGRNINLLTEQVKTHKPEVVAIEDENLIQDLKDNINNLDFDKQPLVLFGSAPKALEVLLDLVSQGAIAPSLIIGMPVGFINVIESKELLSKMDIPQIRIDGNRGGAAMAAATVNALLRAS